MSDQKNHGPPIPKLGNSYLMFKKEVSLWSVTTTVDKKRQAGTIIFSLPDKAKAEALEIPLSELQDGRTYEENGENKTMSGIECLLGVLDKIYLEDTLKRSSNAMMHSENLLDLRVSQSGTLPWSLKRR